MHKLTFKIPLYDYSVIVALVESSADIEVVRTLLAKYDLDAEDIESTCSNIKNDRVDGGQHFYYFEKHISIILAYRQTSISQLLKTIGHEKRHLEDRLMELFNVNDIESAGILSGWLTEKIMLNLIKSNVWIGLMKKKKQRKSCLLN